ncbi:sphingosine kinase 2 isoform X4 [Mangifera indica]|uniref:sphingosine kinase 2 isoform X4 n=1 Tax=Mangifera indica TaxID=29780 RepID=UPI001CFA6496|nr:sphingosine kinase 2 isoform X4 [Mangifera indica]
MAQDSLSDRVLVNGTIVSATLTADGKLSWTEGFHRTLTLENEVLGFAVDANKIRIRAVIEEESRIWCGGRTGGLMRKDFVFEPLSQESRRLWCQKLREYLDSLGMFSKMLSKFICLFRFMLCRMFVFYFCEGRPKSLFIFLNPFGGKKTASKIFLDNVKPLLEDADIQFTLEETTRQLYAKDVAKGLDLSKYDGIVCVSGDGILVEVLEMAWLNLYWIQLVNPVKHIMPLLLLFEALQRILCLRQYNGRVSFVPATGFEDYGEPTSYNGKSINEKNVGDPSQEQPSKARQYGYQGTDVSLENLGWRTINGPFVSVWLHNVPWGGEDTMAAPDAKFSDGYLDLILIRDCPKLDLLKLMTQLSNGGHIKSKYVQYLKVKAFILEPGTCTHDPTREGIIDSDGEVLARGKGTYLCDQKTLMAYDKLQITLDQGLASLFSPV